VQIVTVLIVDGQQKVTKTKSHDEMTVALTTCDDPRNEKCGVVVHVEGKDTVQTLAATMAVLDMCGVRYELKWPKELVPFPSRLKYRTDFEED
jgi:hypothetical protein